MADLIDPSRKEGTLKKTPYFTSILSNLTLKEILQQSSEAVSFLHSLNMIHKNLHPDNFLISSVDSSKGHFRIKLTDFQLSKNIQTSPHDCEITNMKGWIAPESFKNEIKIEDKLDAFVMGCYYFYVLSEGIHPFGEEVETQRSRIRDTNDKVYYEEWDGKPEWSAYDADQVHTLLNQICTE